MYVSNKYQTLSNTVAKHCQTVSNKYQTCECNARVVERATSMGVGMRAGTTWQDGKERHKASRPPALACLCACTCACACVQEGGLVGGCSRKAVGLPHIPIACACTAGACVRACACVHATILVRVSL